MTTLPTTEPAPVKLARDLAEAAGALAASGSTADSPPVRPGAALPPAMRARLARLTRPPAPGAGYRVVKGLFSAFGDQGPTATHWKDTDRERTAALDLGIVLVAALHGEVFGWANQQDGHLVHNILPSPQYAHMQVGGSSTTALSWHTEDAFHPDRADFLLLVCVRNPDGIGSRIATVGSLDLEPDRIARLSEPRLVIHPDDSYQPDGSDPDDSLADGSAGHRGPDGMATLSYRSGRMCLRYDPTYTRMLTDDPAFLDAYEELGRQLEERSRMVALEPGDLLIVDNDAAVHGRGSFRARYDGTDRWLKRVLVRSGRSRPPSERHEQGFGQRQTGWTRPASGERR